MHQREGDEAVFWVPPYHDMGLVGAILQPMYAKFPVNLMAPSTFSQRPIRWLEAMSRYRATTSGAPNFAYDLCAERISEPERASLDLSRWRIAINGAEPVRADTIDRFVAAFAPQGNFVLQGVNYRFKSANFAPTYGVSGQLVLVGAAQDSSVSLELWKVDTASGSVPQQLPIDDAGARTRDGLSAEWVAIAETGTEFVWQIGRFRMNGNTVGCTQRAIEYRALPSHPTVQAGQLLRPAIALPDANQCRSFGPATFSPFMTPGATPTMSGQRARKRAAQTAQRQ